MQSLETHQQLRSSLLMGILLVVFTFSVIQKITIFPPGETAFLYFFFFFSCGSGGGGLPKKTSLIHTFPAWTPSQWTHVPFPARITHEAKGKPRSRSSIYSHRGGGEAKRWENKTRSIPRMHRSEPVFHLCCFSCLSWVSVTCNQTNPNTRTQGVHLPSRPYSSGHRSGEGRGEQQPGIVQWGILARGLARE